VFQRFNNLSGKGRGLLALGLILFASNSFAELVIVAPIGYEGGNGTLSSATQCIQNNLSVTNNPCTGVGTAVWDLEGTSFTAWGMETQGADASCGTAIWHCNSVCPTGFTVTSGGQCLGDDGFVGNPSPSQCQVGTTKTLTKISTDLSIFPTNFCGQDGCRYQSDGGAVIYMGAVDARSLTYTANAVECTVGQDADTQELVLPGKQCLTDSYGNQLCLEDKNTNCGEFNGSPVCVEDIPTDGTCTLLGGGGFICDDPQTPPDNVDGTPQNEVGTLDDPLTGNQGIIYDAGGGADAQKIFQNNQDLKIDETGTPTGTDTMFDKALDLTGLDTLLAGIGGEGEGGGVAGAGGSVDISVLGFELPDTATCQSITSTWRGQTIVFPGADGCIKLDKFRSIMGWMFYILTAFYLVSLATRKPV